MDFYCIFWTKEGKRKEFYLFFGDIFYLWNG